MRLNAIPRLRIRLVALAAGVIGLLIAGHMAASPTSGQVEIDLEMRSVSIVFLDTSDSPITMSPANTLFLAQLDITIANNSAFASAANMYIANPAYVSSDGNQKVVKTNEGRAYLEYDDYTGYKLSLPIGQSSILMMQCVSFPDDDAVVSAVNSVDIARIKELLGEH